MRKSPMKARGTRAQVMHGTALKTPGGLTKSQLKYNKQGRIVSKKKSARAKRENRLVKAGYKTTKGEFGSKLVESKKKSPKKKKSPRRK